MGDDAQTALLKTLEEPPRGTTIVLCADDEDRLMPTVRSRCARIRLGPVATREVEALLADEGLADPPLAARLARLSAGRPGLSQTLARSPDAVAARDELVRVLVDLLHSGPAARLAAVRELLARAGEMARAIDLAAMREDGTSPPQAAAAPKGRRRGAAAAGAGRAPSTTGSSAARSDGSGDEATAEAAADLESDGAGSGPAAASAAERRRGAAILIGLWRDLGRDLLLVRLGLDREIRDPALLDDLRAAAAADGKRGDDGRDLAGFLARLDADGELLEANVRPELLVDSLLLAWPRWSVPDGSR
jgi:hypothetical protein